MSDDFEVDPSDKKELGRSGEYIAAIGIGTWDIRSESRMVEALTYAIDSGLNVIDTAEMYGGGRAEEIVGIAVKRVGRDNVFLTTKLMPDKFVDVDTGVKAMEASLRRLGVSYVDLLLIHWYSPPTPVKLMVRVLESIADKGYTRYIGVSNFGVKTLGEAIKSLSKYEIVVNQVKYSVLDRSIELDLLPYMVDEGITVQAYTPLERGRVVNNKVLKELGGRYGVTPVQVALNYLISHHRVTTIPKTERLERVEEFKGALGWRLTPQDILRLKHI
jgi:diketogulonate reductase-like aldo/keto reductase